MHKSNRILTVLSGAGRRHDVTHHEVFSSSCDNDIYILTQQSIVFWHQHLAARTYDKTHNYHIKTPYASA